MPPSLLRWLSDASVFPFIMNADERLLFTIGITRQSIYWSGRQTAEALSALGQHAGQLAIGTGTHRLCIAGGPIAGYGGDFTKYT
jgi:hypothetical protein